MTWKITALEKVDLDGFPGCVTRIYYECSDKRTVSGWIDVPFRTDDHFTPLEALTQETVMEWIVEIMGADWVRSIEAGVAIEPVIEPTPAIITPPWENA